MPCVYLKNERRRRADSIDRLKHDRDQSYNNRKCKQKEETVKKILTITAIVFLTACTAAFASPSTEFPITTTTGTLYFISNLGVETSDSTTATIEIELPVTTVTGAPPNFYFGVLKLTPVSGTTLTVEFAAVRDEGVFRLTGRDSQGDLVRADAVKGHRYNKATNSWDEAVSISGFIDGPSFTGHFQGVLFE